MRNLWKWSGTYLTITGIIHTIVAVAMFPAYFWAMLKKGFLNTGGEGPGFWFFLLGPVLLMFGPLLQHYIRETMRPAPMWFGIALLVFSLAGCLVYPVSGFWLFVPQAIIIIVANYRTKR